MKPTKYPNKGPQGKDGLEQGEEENIGCQEEYETNKTKDVVTDIPSMDPFELKAPDSDHTPNHTAAPKSSKPEYGKFSTGRFGL